MKNVLEMLEQTAEQYPERTAVSDQQTSLTWAELRRRAGGIGAVLADELEGNQPVVVFAAKRVATLAIQLGVVYAGGFYVPVSRDQPAERIGRILRRLGRPLVIAADSLRSLVEETGFDGTVLSAEALYAQEAGSPDERLREVRSHTSEKDLLYGIFTSGSSGEPKCVSVSHRAVLDFIAHFTRLFGISAADRIGNQAPFDFDVSVKDIYSAMATGAELVLIDRKLFSLPAKLIDYLNERKVTVLTWAVSALTTVSTLKGLDYDVPKSVRIILFSGEAMPLKQLKVWRGAMPGTEFVNLYGPSEITCNCTFYRIPADAPEDLDCLPIGKPFPGRTVRLLDEAGCEVTEPGKPGEICVSGESLAEGYYHDPERTAKSFVLFENAEGRQERMYRTGDLAHYDPSGNLVFEGRKDFQIKLMGHRIELEEIEKAMTDTDGVAEACCIFLPETRKIVAFFTGTEDSRQVRMDLVTRLPRYMIPGKFIRLDRFPLNKNGKKDRNELRRLAIGGRKA